jgi:CRISPR-associated endonuclease/helicase Cas3
MENPEILLFWAKTLENNPETYHPVLYHMLDVANVSLLLWNEVIHPEIKQHINKELMISEQDIPFFIAWVSGLHDIGKVTPAFQRKNQTFKTRLSERGYNFPLVANDLHGILSSVIIQRYLIQKDINNCITAKNISQLTGGHHGVFPDAYSMQYVSRSIGNQRWIDIQTQMIETLWELIANKPFPQFKNLENDITNPLILPSLSGLVSISDWIGSNIDYFPYNNSLSPNDYAEVSKENANKALKKLGYLPVINSHIPSLSFNELFGFEPNGLQKKVIEMVSNQREPYLMAVEARMGQGKTEAAIYSIDRSLINKSSSGFYIALPTQATSNAMYDRVKIDYLQKKSLEKKQSLQLVHGNALMDAIFKESLKIQGIEDGKEDNYSAQTWFTARKRPLLAYMGVGTIDQSLMSVLQTRHWFVRLFGLSRKVVVFDEVHAYDTYMSTILERLISWLSTMECTVILLSATLPKEKLAKFISAYSPGTQISAFPCYPRVTICKKNNIALSETLNEKEKDETVFVKFIPSDINQISSEFKNIKGCMAVICNTVDRAQEIYQHLKSLNIPECRLILFHARFPFIWRKECEKEVLKLFGKPGNSNRPAKAIIVATQVIEQSLDIDFDAIYSDIAPVDLILQRMGRLWRHKRPLESRGSKNPLFNIFIDNPEDNSVPGQITSSRIYSPYILLKSYLALINQPVNNGQIMINIPKGIDSLVQNVYCEGNKYPIPPGWENDLADLRQSFAIESQNDENTASNLLVNKPINLDDLLESFNTELSEDENPEIAEKIRAATRLGDPSITVICLNEDEDKLYPIHSEVVINLEKEPDLETTKRLLEASLSISHRGIFYQLRAIPTPSSWKHNSCLKYSKPLIFKKNRMNIGNYIIEIDKNIGVSIRREQVD